MNFYWNFLRNVYSNFRQNTYRNFRRKCPSCTSRENHASISRGTLTWSFGRITAETSEGTPAGTSERSPTGTTKGSPTSGGIPPETPGGTHTETSGWTHKKTSEELLRELPEELLEKFLEELPNEPLQEFLVELMKKLWRSSGSSEGTPLKTSTGTSSYSIIQLYNFGETVILGKKQWGLCTRHFNYAMRFAAFEFKSIAIIVTFL